MDQKIILLPALLLLIWTGIYFLLRGRMLSKGQQTTYAHWIHASLADMFYNINEKRIFQIVISVTIIGMLLGFFIPGKVSQADKKTPLHRPFSSISKKSIRRLCCYWKKSSVLTLHSFTTNWEWHILA
jgi:hypothetical protein